MKCLNDYLSSTLKDLVTKRKAFALRIDGKLLHQGEYADCYIDVLYYYLFGRHYSNKNNQGYCHICGNYAVLPKNVALNQKFYGTTNPLYFDSVDNRFTSNAFSMCETCNQRSLLELNILLPTLIQDYLVWIPSFCLRLNSNLKRVKSLLTLMN